jgi:thiol-disulfide isomerase/thioredoxin
LETETCLVYYHSPNCKLCDALNPKIKNLLAELSFKFPFIEIDTSKESVRAARNLVFSAPVLVFYYHGSELFRLAGVFGLNEAERKIRHALLNIDSDF